MFSFISRPSRHEFSNTYGIHSLRDKYLGTKHLVNILTINKIKVVLFGGFDPITVRLTEC